MELETLLLLVAFRNRIHGPDLDGGLSLFSEIVGEKNSQYSCTNAEVLGKTSRMNSPGL
jgi:hypothetical protein